MPRKIRLKPLAYSLALLCGVSMDATANFILEEIIVTAQKREQSIQDVGISVSALDGNQLDNLGITNTIDITQQIPGFQVSTFTPAFTIFNLRGISQNNFQDNLEAPIAVYVDGAYFSSMNAIGGQLFDINRVEVLRGPQGTLFGRNSTGGLVHYLTRGADESETNGYFEATIGRFNERVAEGAVGFSLADNVRARLAGRKERADGYIESSTPGVRDSHGKNSYAVRGALQVDFTDDITADLRLSYTEDNDVPSGTYVASRAEADAFGLGTNRVQASDPFTHNSTFSGGFSRYITNMTGEINWDLGDDMQFVSLSNYQRLDKDYLEDAGAGLFLDAISAIVDIRYGTSSDVEQFSQEFRLSGDEGGFRWQAGAYYLNINLEAKQTLKSNLFLGEALTGFDATVVNDTALESQNYSVFGQAELDFADIFTAIAGVRWSVDTKDIAIQRTGSGFTAPANNGPADESGLDPFTSIDYEDYAARLQLNAAITDGTLLFVSANRGIKGGNWSIDITGGINGTDTVDIDDFQHKEEVLWSYEFGVKSDVTDWMRVNATAFYYDYNDYQAFALINLVPQVRNTDAESHGGEIEIFLTPLDGLDAILGASYIESKVDEIEAVTGDLIQDLDLPQAPQFSVNWLARYAIPMGDGELAMQVDGTWNDDQFLEGTNSQSSLQKAHAVWNANVSYNTDVDGGFKVTGWIKNAFDEEYRVYSLDLAAAFELIEEIYAPRRTYGVTAAIKF